jgi:hypothetical protein
MRRDEDERSGAAAARLDPGRKNHLDVLVEAAVGDGPEVRILGQGRAEAAPGGPGDLVHALGRSARHCDRQIVPQPFVPPEARAEGACDPRSDRRRAFWAHEPAAPPERRERETLKRPDDQAQRRAQGVPFFLHLPAVPRRSCLDRRRPDDRSHRARAL